jgi:hypothetical protein
MSVTKRIVLIAVVVMLGVFANVAGASMIDTTTWNPETNRDGTGVGILDGITVTYTTANTGPTGSGTNRNAGYTVVAGLNWNTNTVTSPIPCSTCSDTSAALLGTEIGVGAAAPSGQAQSIHFSAPVFNPYLFVVFGDPGSSMDFGATTLTLLSSNNATLSGNIVTFGSGATNTAGDGFVARFSGSFENIAFQFIRQPQTTQPPSDTFNGVTFTVGVDGAVPEPASLGLGLAGIVGMLIYRRRTAVR